MSAPGTTPNLSGAARREPISRAATKECWAVLWHQHNLLDGVTRHLMRENTLPVLFPNRAGARAYIRENFGYIRHRADLRAEPHGWRMPRAVRVKLAVSVVNDGAA